jgi:hypothetical protein
LGLVAHALKTLAIGSFAGLRGFGAAAARVGGFPLLAMLILVADEDPAFEAGAWPVLVVGFGNFGERTPYNIAVHSL